MAKNLEVVMEELLQDSRHHAAVMVGGDCAYLKGESKDYQTLLALLEPLAREACPSIWHWAITTIESDCGRPCGPGDRSRRRPLIASW